MPSFRERKRYVVFEIISKKESSAENFSRAFEKAASKLFGEFGKAKINSKVLIDKWNQKAQIGIMRVNRESVDYARAVFCAMDKIGRSAVIVRSLGVSGTLRKAERKYNNS